MNRYLHLALIVALLGCTTDPVVAIEPEDEDGPDSTTTVTVPASFKRELKPCTIELVPAPTLCGTYTVFEDREAQAGRSIDLNVLVVKALEADAEPDPVIYFEGGPGGSSVDAAPYMMGDLTNLRQRRDLIFVDQRGTGASGRLACNTPLPRGEASLFGSLFPDDHIQACAARLGAGADLRQYATSVAVDDIDEVLEWLGYEQVNLFGTSYGTRMALVYLQRHPDRVRSVIVNGVAPPHVDIHLYDAQNVDRSLDWLFTDCEQDAACASEYPNLRAHLETLVARFDEGPIDVVAQLPNGTEETVSFSRGDLGYALRGMLYGPLAANIPAWVADAIATDGWSHFPDYYVQRSRWVATGFATGMHLSVFCTEDIPFTSEAEVAELSKGTLLGDALYRHYAQACKQWPQGKVPSGYHEPIVSDKPVLIVSGERDPATPMTWGDEIAATLSNSLHIVVPDAGHVPLTPCVLGIQNRFVESGSVVGLNAGCVDVR